MFIIFSLQQIEAMTVYFYAIIVLMVTGTEGTKEATLETIISEDLIVVDPELASQRSEEVIKLLCDRLEDQGYVDESYYQLVIEREREFPTGLPTKPHAAAIPHAAGGGVRKTGLAVAVLPHDAVLFHAMDDPDKVLDVRIVILMAIVDSANQVPMLQWICTLIQDEGLVDRLLSAVDAAEVLDTLRPVIDQQGGTDDV